MKKQLINEILRMKVLSNYDTKNTFSENSEIILERTTLKTLAKDARYLEALRLELDDLLKLTGPLGSKGMLKSADDVIFALKNQSMSVADLGKLNRTVLKTSKNPALRKSAASWVVSTETFSKAFSSGTATQRLAKLKELNPNMSDNMLRDLHTANELRLKNLGKSGKNIGQGGKEIGQGGKEIGQGGKEIGQGGKEIGQGGKMADNSINITIDMGNGQRKILKNGDEYVRYLDDEAEMFGRTYGRDFDDLAKKNGHENFKKWMAADEEGAMRSIANDGKKGKGIFGRIINWGKRRLKWKTLWSLAKIAGVSYGVWWLFFKKDGFTVECDEGSHFEEGKGCIPNKTDGGGDDGGGGGGDSTKTISDNDGNKYIECSSPYYKGCTGRKGDDNIKKAQDCLGVTTNGFFNQETEDALYKKINKKSFSPTDLPTICARSLGGSSFQI